MSTLQAQHPPVRAENAEQAATVPSVLSRWVRETDGLLAVQPHASLGSAGPALASRFPRAVVTLGLVGAALSPFLGFALASALLVLATVLDAGILAVGALLVIVALVPLGILAVATIPVSVAWATTLEVRPGSYRRAHPFAASRTPDALVMKGLVGTRMVLASAHGTVLQVQAGKQRYTDVRALAQRIADRMEVPLMIELDEAAWNRWDQEARYRARVDYERRIEKSRQRFPDKYAVSATEPGDLAIEADRMRTWNTVLGHDGLDHPDLRLPWEQVLDAELIVTQISYQTSQAQRFTTDHAAVLVLTPSGVHRIHAGYATDAHVAKVLWLRDRIREHACTPAAERGSIDDVPEVLLQAHQARS